MLMIRLARFGKKKQPFYRVVVNEKQNPPTSKVVEYLGTYNPKSKELIYDKDRMAHWLKTGACYSRTVGMILVKEGLLKKEDLPKLYTVEKKRKPKKEVPEEQAQPAATEVPAEPAAA